MTGWTPPGPERQPWTPPASLTPPGGWQWTSPEPPPGRRPALVALGLDVAAVALALLGVPFLIVGVGIVMFFVALGVVVLAGALAAVAAVMAVVGPREGRLVTLALTALPLTAGALVAGGAIF